MEAFNHATMASDTDNYYFVLKFAFFLNIGSLDALCGLAMFDYICKTF